MCVGARECWVGKRRDRLDKGKSSRHSEDLLNLSLYFFSNLAIFISADNDPQFFLDYFFFIITSFSSDFSMMEAYNVCECLD